jgi:hypothetical protein
VIIFGQRRRYDSLEWILSRVRGTRRPGNYRGSMERILPPARGVSSIGSTVGDAVVPVAESPPNLPLQAALVNEARQCRFADHPTEPVTPLHSLVAIARNGWSRSIGTPGRNQSESVVAIRRCAENRTDMTPAPIAEDIVRFSTSAWRIAPIKKARPVRRAGKPRIWQRRSTACEGSLAWTAANSADRE